MKTFYWLLKREYWEHRGGFLWAPVIAGGIYLLLTLVALVSSLGNHGPIMMIGGRDLAWAIDHADPENLQKAAAVIDGIMMVAAVQVLVVTGFVMLFYFIGCLYNDRADRSILFWKSLPISNINTVLSKAVCGGLLVPAFSVLIGVTVGVLQLLIIATLLAFQHVNAWQLLLLAHPVHATASLFSSIPLNALWALPSIGWLMLCSSWSRTKPFLWAVLIPVVGGLMLTFSVLHPTGVNTIWMWKNIILRVLLSVFPGSGFFFEHGHMGNIGNDVDSNNPLAMISPLHTYPDLLSSPNLWVGVAAGAVMIALAIWFRRVRDDS
ncbi:hypothetical protein [Dyella sp. RRB7]|uniref:hypothetical protein n=1 Tax=Dyella sp. RRB7 TaxID=2919502 RepID=UPI001FAABF07|nr:hypothetical protein [Dyella sp. RRB7]